MFQWCHIEKKIWIWSPKENFENLIPAHCNTFWDCSSLTNRHFFINQNGSEDPRPWTKKYKEGNLHFIYFFLWPEKMLTFMKLCTSHLSTKHQLQKYKKLNNIYSEDDFSDKTVIKHYIAQCLIYYMIYPKFSRYKLLLYIIFDQVLYSKLLVTSCLIMLA